MAVITSAQITTVAIVGTTPHRPQPPLSHIIFITIAFPFAFLDPYIHRRPSPASGNLLCAFGHAGDLPEAAPFRRAAVRFHAPVQPSAQRPRCLILSIITPIANGHTPKPQRTD
jgi:hypothetical protein